MHPLTMTHARIRAAQGDLAGARRVLRGILERQPTDASARELLARLEGADSRAGARRDEDEPDEPDPVAAEARRLAASFRRALGSPSNAPRRRIRRLERWLSCVGSQADRAGAGD